MQGVMSLTTRTAPPVFTLRKPVARRAALEQTMIEAVERPSVCTGGRQPDSHRQQRPASSELEAPRIRYLASLLSKPPCHRQTPWPAPPQGSGRIIEQEIAASLSSVSSGLSDQHSVSMVIGRLSRQRERSRHQCAGFPVPTKQLTLDESSREDSSVVYISLELVYLPVLSPDTGIGQWGVTRNISKK